MLIDIDALQDTTAPDIARPTKDVTYEGLVLSGTDLRPIVRRELTRRGPFGELDGLAWAEAAYEALHRDHPVVAVRLARAVGDLALESDRRLVSIAIRFFLRFPHAAGGEQIRDLAATGLERFRPGEVDPLPLGPAPCLRSSLLKCALGWRDGQGELDPAVIAAARRDIVAGDGAGLIGLMWTVDGHWMRRRQAQVLALYPDHVAATFLGLADQGVPPQLALDVVLGSASPSGRSALASTLRWAYTGYLRRALMERLKRAA